jgi:FdhE protein
MLHTLKAEKRLIDIPQALEDIRRRRPPLAPMAEAAATLAQAREDYAATRTGGPVLDPVPDEARLCAGFPLLDGQSLAPLAESFRTAAGFMLPALARAFVPLAGEAARLGEALAAGPDLALAILALGPAPEQGEMAGLSERTGISPEVLHLLVDETLKAVLAPESAQLIGRVAPSVWFRGTCPVCGAAPDLSLLKDKPDPSEFLISKAGQLWLHCSRCSALWRYLRVKCPGCACDDQEKLESLVAGDDDTERVSLCHACRTYLPGVNLVERVGPVNLEMAPVSLLHLDILAQERGFAPLADTPWNRLGPRQS